MASPSVSSPEPLPVTRVAGPTVPRLNTVTSLPPVDKRKSYLESAAFSPVNENGSFEFDRVIKASKVLKRGRKTKNYRVAHIVLRPLSLSLYSDVDHTALRHSIPLSDITAVARQRKTKRPDAARFTVFSPARNFHFDAQSEELADQWVDQIRIAARIDEWEDINATSEEDADTTAAQGDAAQGDAAQGDAARAIPKSTQRAASGQQAGPYGTSVGSFSSISSVGASNFPGSSLSLAAPATQTITETSERPSPSRTASLTVLEEEKVLRNGRLYLLKSKGGVKKWKPVWAVLRPKSIAIYPDEQEYAPLLIIQFPSIVNAVEIDSPSRNKKRQFCMQIITEERNWRFCAQDEDDLARWLGTIKSLLVKRRGTTEGIPPP